MHSATDPSSSHQLESVKAQEPRAPVAVLTPAQCKALLACLHAGTLIRSRGSWQAEADESDQRMSGITIADLGREGLLTINISGKHKSACLTEKGGWFARTLAAAHSEA